jgi:hypothetical protein
MENSKILAWIFKYIDCIVIISLVIIFFAPSFISQPYSEWWTGCPIFGNIDFSETGQIGDTIGGITAPFIGVLSILLLYITLKVQIKVNKSQQHLNDLDTMWKMTNDILKLVSDFNVSIEIENEDTIIYFDNILELKGKSLKTKEFLKLYDGVSYITNLCFLAYDFIENSTLPNGTKRTFLLTFWLHSKNAEAFWVLCCFKEEIGSKGIRICDGEESNLLKRKSNEINKYIDRLNKYIEQYKAWENQ